MLITSSTYLTISRLGARLACPNLRVLNKEDQDFVVITTLQAIERGTLAIVVSVTFICTFLVFFIVPFLVLSHFLNSEQMRFVPIYFAPVIPLTIFLINIVSTYLLIKLKLDAIELKLSSLFN